jgi:cation diffusion facilitator family transporter
MAVALGAIDLMLMGTAASQSNSLTILGDLLKESLDWASVVMSWVTFRLVRGRDRTRYAYGIGKLENLISLLIALLMAGSACFIGWSSWQRLLHPHPIEGGWMGWAVFVVYSLISLGIALMHRRADRQQPSPLLQLQVRLYVSKALFDALMASALGLSLTWPEASWTTYLDPLAAMCGVAFMMYNVWSTTESSVHDLLDVTINEQMQIQILECLVRHFDRYTGLHGIRTRRSGPLVFVDILLQFDPEAKMAEVEQHVTAIEHDIRSTLGHSQISIVLSRGPLAAP